MQVFGLVGWSGSGKTTLLVALLPLLRAHGLRISTIKHAHAGFDMDTRGKDSHRHRDAGAHEVLVAGAGRWALLHEITGPEPTLPDLLARLDPVDLVLVEGFKSHSFPRLEVYRPALGKPPIWPSEPGVVAVATDDATLSGGLSCGGRPVLPLDTPDAVAAWLVRFLHAAPARRAAG
jgi:molybdopterin-guanine dinucleotide biosynthesis protein B